MHKSTRTGVGQKLDIINLLRDRSRNHRVLARAVAVGGFFFLLLGRALALPAEPRIVNIYNFVRNSDFRLPHSRELLFEATSNQITLFHTASLPVTWALEYDALINPAYQKLFKERATRRDEIAAWWELPRSLVEKAGITWRGRHDWDPAADVGFSPGYTPAERRRLVDVYMAEFKSVFGCYPKTAGSWYIDEVTLAYMADRYGLIASCNCKDQVGTDGYTLWGGYWNQAYYPSRWNAYMPAQTKAGQINVPIFRMLGSDPIYQHGTTPGMFTLEPVYRNAGGSAEWVVSFMKNLIQEPSLAFAYTQAGQENSFGWDAMKTGLTLQTALLKQESQAGQIQVLTLAQSGEWFRKHFSVTPATSVVATDDWKHQDRQTVWYDSRFYRVNILWEDHAFFIRDLHRFDENLVSPTHDTALTERSLSYDTLPVMDAARWSESDKAGIWPVALALDGTASPLVPAGPPVITERNHTDLSIVQALNGGGKFTLVCQPGGITCSGVDGQGASLPWAWNLVGGARQKSCVQAVAADHVAYQFAGVNYDLRLAPGAGACRQLPNGDIQLTAGPNGKLVLILDSTTSTSAAVKASAATRPL